jgi:hypothetical protein
LEKKFDNKFPGVAGKSEIELFQKKSKKLREKFVRSFSDVAGPYRHQVDRQSEKEFALIF